MRRITFQGIVMGEDEAWAAELGSKLLLVVSAEPDESGLYSSCIARRLTPDGPRQDGDAMDFVVLEEFYSDSLEDSCRKATIKKSKWVTQ